VLTPGVLSPGASLSHNFGHISTIIGNVTTGSGEASPSNAGVIVGTLVGILLLVALGIFLFIVLRRTKEDQDDGEAMYETETEAAEEMIDTSLSEFGESVDGDSFMEVVGLDGGFAISDAFAQNPEEARLFF
jgi:hypothetical protein